MGPLIDLLPLGYAEAVVLVGAAVIGLAAGVLGSLAVLQQRSLVGDALAHAALPGVAIAFILTGAKDPFTLLLGAAFTGLVGALLMIGIERSSRTKPDAAIGVVLAGFFSLGIVLLTYVAGTGNAQQAGLERYLFGQAAGLLESDVNAMAILTAVALVALMFTFRALKTTLFDRSFAATVGLRVRVLEVGSTGMLVVAIIIGVRAVVAIVWRPSSRLEITSTWLPGRMNPATPSTSSTRTVTARQFTSRLSRLLPLAGVVGMAVGATGALLASRAEVPTGPVIVLLGVLLAVIAILIAPHRGLLWRARQRVRSRRTALGQGVLIDLETAMHTGPPPTVEELRLSTGRTRSGLQRGLSILERAGLIVRDGERVMLNEQGAAAAHSALESRRLWGAWLGYGAQLPMTDAREPDPRDVRGSLGDELTERLLDLSADAAAR